MSHVPDNPIPGRSTNSQLVAVSEIIKQLDFATQQNIRLKQAIEENNRFFESKLQESQSLGRSHDLVQ